MSATTSNPLVAQGTLNRLRGSVVIPTFPFLNVTASYLGREGIRLALEGQSTLMLPTLTGQVTSPEPYMSANVMLNLLKTQGLSDLYKLQMESDSRIGDIIVTPDASTLSKYQFSNCAIETVRELPFDGSDPGFVVTLRGTYLINNNLWGLG